MATPDEEIRAFLSGGDADDSRRLNVASLFARSMLTELRTAVAEWEATAATIEQARASQLPTALQCRAGCTTVRRASRWPQE